MLLEITALADLGDYEECLIRAARCRAEELVRFAAPRADEFFTLVGRELRTSFCPAPVPTATATKTATATPALTPTRTSTPNPTPTAILFNRVFVTSTDHAANFGGATAADTICQTHATNAGLPGTYVAWVSDASSTAVTRLGSARGFVRVDGAPFADTLSDITSTNKILNPLRIDENGVDVGTVGVWTGTNANGTAHGSTCSNWTSTSGSGQTGSTQGGPNAWTSRTTQSCMGPLRLYCFQKDNTTALAFTPAAGSIVFLTGATFAPGAGIAAADTLCATEASNAGLAGTYQALLATTTQSAAARAVIPALNTRKDGVFVGSSGTLGAGGTLASGIWQNAADRRRDAERRRHGSVDVRRLDERRVRDGDLRRSGPGRLVVVERRIHRNVRVRLPALLRARLTRQEPTLR